MASRKGKVRAQTPESDAPDAAETSEESSTTDSEEEPEPANPSTEMSSMSFEELLGLQSAVGRKTFQRAQQAEQSAQRPPRKQRAQPSNTGPQEMSSKKPVPFLRKALPCKKTTHRDPRFDDLSGEFSAEVFEKTYRFLGDIKQREREAVEKKLRRTRQPELKEKLEQLLRRMDQQEAAAQQKRHLRERELDYKRQLREHASQGHKPFYLKKGELRRMELREKYRELKQRGKLEHFLSKKRKRNSNKDRRRLPNQ